MNGIDLYSKRYLNVHNKFNEVDVSDFYNIVPVRYLEIRRFACKMISMFSSIYQCEQLFS